MVQYYDVTAASGSRAVPSRGQMPETQNLKKNKNKKKQSRKTISTLSPSGRNITF
jgi:hypothetical protein